MRIVISGSGPCSQKVGVALRDWLAVLLEELDVWMTPDTMLEEMVKLVRDPEGYKEARSLGATPEPPPVAGAG